MYLFVEMDALTAEMICIATNVLQDSTDICSQMTTEIELHVCKHALQEQWLTVLICNASTHLVMFQIVMHVSQMVNVLNALQAMLYLTMVNVLLHALEDST